MSIETYKNNKKIIGSIIKINRINHNLSQKELSKGICVPSYLSRIENGELIPSEDLLTFIFAKLGLTFNDSDKFIKEGLKQFELLFDKLNYNEFEETNAIFAGIEANENDYITSPLIIEYYLAKLARYCSTPNRDKFESSKDVLLSSFELLSANQRFLFNFYVGVDILNISQNKSVGKKYIQDALSFKENGHCYFWLSYAYRIEDNTIKAYDSIKKALALYVEEGNIISIMSCYEKLAEVYFMLDNYSDAVYYLQMALKMAKKLKNEYLIEHLNSMIAWTYYRLSDYNSALTYLSYNTGLVDHRMIIPDSIVESLIYFSLKDKDSLKISIEKIRNSELSMHISEDLRKIFYEAFAFYIKNDNYIKSHIWEGLLIYISDSLHNLVELKKVFVSLLKEYYIHNRRYKDALFL